MVEARIGCNKGGKPSRVFKMPQNALSGGTTPGDLILSVPQGCFSMP